MLGPEVNSAGHDAFARVSSDGKRMWFQRDNGWAWVSNRESLEQPWQAAQRINNDFESIGAVADMFVSRDELTWMFVTWTDPNYIRLMESNRPSRDAPWPNPRPLTEALVTTQFPVMTDDGLTLYVSKHFPTAGGYEICVSTRPDLNSPWSNPTQIPAPVNTTADERPLWISKDQLTLIFQAQGGPRTNSFQYDLFFTTRPSLTEPWQAPVNFGSSINSNATEASAWLSDDGRELIFSRERLGKGGEADLFVSRRVPKKKLSATGWHGWPADAPPPAIAPFAAEQAQQHQAAWAKYLGVPVEYTNSLGMKFRLIPPGEFLMGSMSEEIAATLKDVSPGDMVILTQPIYLGVNEVTQAEYEKVMGVNPSHFAPLGMGKEAVAGLDTAEHPVEMVSWNDAAEFSAKLSQQEKLKPFYFREGETIAPLVGTGYRLPSETEWEFACRAGTATKYWIGDQNEDLLRAGWFRGNSGGRTHAAGELKANPFGLADIHGNVWEWVQDGWGGTFDGQFQDKPAINPNVPFHAYPQRVLRGGHWQDSASNCRSSNRLANVPTNRNLNLGFRVSLPVDTVRQALKPTGPALPQPANASVAKFPPLAPGWFERVSKLPPEEQVKEVAAELKRRNPEWDEKLEHLVEFDWWGVEFDSSHVADITPISALTTLTLLRAIPSNQRGLISDLSPLAGLKDLRNVTLGYCIDLSDLSPLRDLPMAYIDVHHSSVTDISPLAGKPIEFLNVEGCVKLTDLSPLKGAPLGAGLMVFGSGIRDLSPLRDSQITHIQLFDSQFDPEVVCHWPLKEIMFHADLPKVPREKLLRLKEIKTLETINGQPVAEFWKEFDAAADKPVE